MSNQKFTGKSVPVVTGPKAPVGVPSKDSMVKPRHVMASKGISNEQRK